MPILLKLPFSVIQGTHTSLVEPSRDAMEMKRVVTHSPGDLALVRRCRVLVSLAVDATFHDVIAANRTVLNCDI